MTLPHVVLVDRNLGDDFINYSAPQPTGDREDAIDFVLRTDIIDWLESSIDGKWTGLHTVRASYADWHDEVRFENADDAALFTLKWL